MVVIKKYLDAKTSTEYQLTVKLEHTIRSGNVRWEVELAQRKKGYFKWTPILPPSGSCKAATPLGQKRLERQWILTQVPREWWNDVLDELTVKIKHSFACQFK